ncbi:hypothetical protein WJX73_002270 [Symbiochloris irregularis]|uniref:F-box domain-containing protein n=1 Tax=Symbiochloris irregularis TaxID=706552 RepID=A0AAW1P1H0_9CHLO
MMHIKTEEGLSLLELDEGCLSRVLSHLAPLPDLFNVARVCQRFNSLATANRKALLVTATPPPPGSGIVASSGKPCRSAHRTLAAAVANSRAGDTILVEPCTPQDPFHEASNIIIAWPLQIIGLGTAPEDTKLTAVKGAETVLDFRASAKLYNVAVHHSMAPCIIHRKGRLTIQGSLLHSTTVRGLDHLVNPIVANAALPQPTTRSQGPQNSIYNQQTFKPPSMPPPKAESGLSMGGLLTVVETKILGGRGSQACFASGNSRVRNVRVIKLAGSNLFWRSGRA